MALLGRTVRFVPHSRHISVVLSIKLWYFQ
jgi:hypothetical protein